MLDISYTLITCTVRYFLQTLLTQANTRRLKKDRKKEIKDALGRYQVLEDRLQEVKRSKRGSSGLGSSSRFHVDSPSECAGVKGLNVAKLGRIIIYPL